MAQDDDPFQFCGAAFVIDTFDRNLDGLRSPVEWSQCCFQDDFVSLKSGVQLTEQVQTVVGDEGVERASAEPALRQIERGRCVRTASHYATVTIRQDADGCWRSRLTAGAHRHLFTPDLRVYCPSIPRRFHDEGFQWVPLRAHVPFRAGNVPGLNSSRTPASTEVIVKILFCFHG
jgi:hypothetical protein